MVAVPGAGGETARLRRPKPAVARTVAVGGVRETAEPCWVMRMLSVLTRTTAERGVAEGLAV